MTQSRTTHNLKPFFCYYGGKWRAAPHYPVPEYGVVVEPFAGAAGYALRHADRQVHLYDVDPVICGIWDYLIRSKSHEIASLPILCENVDDLPDTVPQEARWLIGFWLNKGAASPCKTPSSWMRQGIRPNSYWGETVRQRISEQVVYIKHWTITQSTYTDIPDMECTWFVDPPYAGSAGRHYRYSDVDYKDLGQWCVERRGQVMVCENEGAKWLPFRIFRTIKASEARTGGKTSKEVIWRNGE